MEITSLITLPIKADSYSFFSPKTWQITIKISVLYLEERQSMKSISLVCGKCYFSFFAASVCYLLCIVVKKSTVFCKYLFTDLIIQPHLPIEDDELLYAIFIYFFTHLTNMYWVVFMWWVQGHVLQLLEEVSRTVPNLRSYSHR